MAVVLPQQNRHGTFTSASVVVPTPPANTDSVGITLNISAGDLSSTKSIVVYIEHSVDDGQTWSYWAGMRWNGPTPDQPALYVDIGPIVGHRIRVTVDIPQTVRVGASVDFVTAPI